MKKCLSFLVIGFCILKMTGCGMEDTTFISDYNEALMKVSEEEVEIRYKELFAFEWDDLYIFAPYTTKDTMEEIIGEKINGNVASVSDGECIFIFCKKGRIETAIRSSELENTIVEYDTKQTYQQVEPENFVEYSWEQDKRVLHIVIERDGS